MKPELLTEQRAALAERKLNIGCGNQPFDGWTNLDIQAGEGVDTVADARALPFFDASFDFIFAGEVLEHIPHVDTRKTLKEWKRVLAPGGTLEFTVPDIDVLCRLFLEDKDGKKWSYWLLALYGRQLWPGDAHMTGFTKERLRSFLEEMLPWTSLQIFNDEEYGRRVHAICVL